MAFPSIVKRLGYRGFIQLPPAMRQRHSLEAKARCGKRVKCPRTGLFTSGGGAVDELPVVALAADGPKPTDLPSKKVLAKVGAAVLSHASSLLSDERTPQKTKATVKRTYIDAVQKCGLGKREMVKACSAASSVAWGLWAAGLLAARPSVTVRHGVCWSRVAWSPTKYLGVDLAPTSLP